MALVGSGSFQPSHRERRALFCFPLHREFESKEAFVRKEGGYFNSKFRGQLFCSRRLEHRNQNMSLEVWVEKAP